MAAAAAKKKKPFLTARPPAPPPALTYVDGLRARGLRWLKDRRETLLRDIANAEAQTGSFLQTLGNEIALDAQNIDSRCAALTNLRTRLDGLREAVRLIEAAIPQATQAELDRLGATLGDVDPRLLPH